MTQIIIKNHKNHNFFFQSIKKNSTDSGAASYEYFINKIFIGGRSRTRWIFLNTLKKNIVFFMIFYDYMGHFRGVSLLNFFWFEPSFLSYRTIHLQKDDFLCFWPYLYFLNYWFLWKFTKTFLFEISF